MSDFARDFDVLMHDGFNIYVEGEDDDSIYLEAHDREDDTHVITASYDECGNRLTYHEDDFIRSIIALLNPIKA